MRRTFKEHFKLPVVSNSPVVFGLTLHLSLMWYGSQSTGAGGRRYASSDRSYVATLFGVTALCLMKQNEENLASTAAQFANYPLTFDAANQFVESYLAVHQFSTFTENRNPSSGKRRVFFKGETLEEAANTMRYGKSPVVTDRAGIVIPKIVDKTLHPHDSEKPGTCRGLVGLTSDLTSLGGCKAVHLVVPAKTKIAPTSLHATDAEHNPQDQFVTAGLAKEDIFATVFRDPLTGAFCDIELNRNFAGDLSQLELDGQMQDIIALLPEGNVKQTLQQCINSELRYQDFYENKLAPCAASHAAAVEARRFYQQINLFGESNAVWLMNNPFSNRTVTVDALQSDETVDHANVIRTSDGKVFVRFGEQRGGNPGGFFMGHDNEPYYIKHAPADELVLTADEEEAGLSITTDDPRRMNSTRFQNEYLMGQLYRAFSIEVPKTHLIYFKKDGLDHVGIASKFERDLVRYDTYQDGDLVRMGWCDSPHFLTKLQRGGLVDFLLGDYDVIGLSFDNTLGKKSKLTGHLNPIRIDPGAGLLFKAKGTPLDLTDDASDFLTDDLEPGNWYDVFGQTFGACFQGLLNSHAVLSDAIDTLEKVSAEQLVSTIRRYGYDDESLTSNVLEIVLRRREAILEQAKKLQRKLWMQQIVAERVAMSNQVEQAGSHNPVRVATNSSWFSFSFANIRRRSSFVAAERSDMVRRLSSMSSALTSSNQAAVDGVLALSESIRRESMRRASVALLGESFRVTKQLSDALEESDTDQRDFKNAEKWGAFGEVHAFDGDSNASSSDNDEEEEEEEESETSSNTSTVVPSKRV